MLTPNSLNSNVRPPAEGTERTLSSTKGFHFLTLDDDNGLSHVIVKPQVYERHRQVFRSTALLVVSGRVQREGAVTNLLAEGGESF